MDKQGNNQGSSDSTTNDDVFADFEPPRTTDGSYKGTMKHIKATEDHLQRKFNEAFVKTTTRLKEAKARVGLKVTGGSIQLQATLPPKPGSDKTKPHQQLVSLGIPANLDGLKTAEEEANELGRLLARKQFDWSEKYLGKKQEETKVPTIGELLDKFEIEYFKTHNKTLTSENTFRNYKHSIKKGVGVDCLADLTEVQNKLANKTPSIKRAATVALNVMLPLFGFDIKIKREKQYVVAPRSIPSDTEIILGFLKYEEYFKTSQKGRKKETIDNWLVWRWIYGMIATFGVRPRELYVASDINWWISPDNTSNTWRVNKDTKTGYREVVPFVPEWIDLFKLKNPSIVQLVKLYFQNKTTVQKINGGVNHNATWFRKCNLGFEPYDLRHACAIRAHLQGVPLKISADNLGHSIDQHTETYQKWIGLEVRLKAINDASTKKSEVEILKDEVTRLTLECERLKLDVERYRLIANHPEFHEK
jgi:integrase